MFKNIKFYINSYYIFENVKIKRYAFFVELIAFPIFLKPWKKITLDFITDLPPNKRGERVYDAILIMVDKYMKMVRYFFTNKTITAIQFSNISFKKNLKYSAPKNYVINRISVFTNAFWCKIYY